jgi:hypothetical protein
MKGMKMSEFVDNTRDKRLFRNGATTALNSVIDMCDTMLGEVNEVMRRWDDKEYKDMDPLEKERFAYARGRGDVLDSILEAIEHTKFVDLSKDEGKALN